MMENITKAIGSAVVSFVIMAPIFLFATSIFCNWNWRITVLLTMITLFEWLFCTTTIYDKVNE